MECSVGRSIRRANLHPVWKVKGWSRWVDPIGGTGCVLGAFVPFGQRVRRAFDIMFDPCTGDDVTIGVTTKHKEEGVRRRDLDTADRNLVMHELNTHAHPLTDKASDLVNIVNRKVADKRINVVDAVSIGEEMSLDFVKSLPDGFHNRLTNRVKTMETMKRGVVVGEKTVCDMEALFSRLLIVGQSRNINLATVFEYELCAVPPSTIDEFGILPEGSKAQLVKKLAVVSTEPSNPDYVIVDAGQLLYHIVWPSGGTVSTIATSMATKLQPYNAHPTTVTVVFDRYGKVSAKDHERERRANGVCAGNYNLTLTSPLPNREAIMKSKANKRLLSRLLCTCTLAPNMLMVGEDEGLFNHEEADVLMVSYMIDAVRDGRKVIPILSDDTDVVVILIFRVRKLSTCIKALVQMEKWDGTVLHINDIVAALGNLSLQLLGMHAVTCCDTVSYPFNKGKLTALSKLREGNFPELYSVVGEETAALEDLLKTGQTFFAALYGQSKCASLNVVRYTIYAKKKGKAPLVKSLPQTDKICSFTCSEHTIKRCSGRQQISRLPQQLS